MLKSAALAIAALASVNYGPPTIRWLITLSERLPFRPKHLRA